MRQLYLLLLLAYCASAEAQTSYFPPISGTWSTVNPESLGWCTHHWDSVDHYLARKNSKSFILLHRGRLVYERYYGTFTRDSLWYWASAGKSLTAFLVGKAQEEGFLTLNDRTDQYLGLGWTSAPPAKEALITLRDQLQMTTGLDYRVPDLDCTADTCLKYRQDAGTQWYYHNAPYLLLHPVMDSATGQNMNLYTVQKLHQTIGFSGLWAGTLYISTARAMARFGHLLLNNGQWNGQAILADTTYLRELMTPSQALNPAYGYLTWLNGQSSYIQPGLPFSFNGPIIPSAPADLYMAAGKNDQRIYVVPSLDLVVVRQGNAADSSMLALSGFDEGLWSRLMRVICTQSIGLAERNSADFSVYPQPAGTYLNLGASWSEPLQLIAPSGRQFPLEKQQGQVKVPENLTTGQYWLRDAAGHTAPVLIRP